MHGEWRCVGGGASSERRHLALTHKDTVAMMPCLHQGDQQFPGTRVLSTLGSFAETLHNGEIQLDKGTEKTRKRT